MSVTNDLTLINDISNFKLGHGVTFVCDVSSLISTYNNFKLYSVDNNDELTELVDVSDNITNGLLVYKYYPQSSGSLNIVLGTEEVSDTIHRSNTIQLRINNNSHAENIFNANAALVANLTSMGVLGASTNDGLATNIAKVTSIPPTQRGIELDTSITCFAPATASVGVPFNITGVLTSSYDDTSQANVDMHGGEIQGATIEIYNGNTLLGTCTTNIDGEYTFTYTPLSTGTLSIKAVYDSANDFYEDSASNSNSVSVHVAVSSVSLVTDKSILSYVDNEYATLTATVLDSNDDPVVGETVSFDIVDPDTGEVISNIDTATTNSNGECNVYYYSNHTNSLYIRAICNSIISTQTYVLDAKIAITTTDKLSSFDTSYINGGSLTVDNNEKAYQFTPSRQRYCTIYLSGFSITKGAKLCMDVKPIYTNSSNYHITIMPYFYHNISTGVYGVLNTLTSMRVLAINTGGFNGNGEVPLVQTSTNHSPNTWYHIEFSIATDNSVKMQLYDMNGNLIEEQSTSQSVVTNSMVNVGLQGYQNNGYFLFKNITVQEL